MKSIRLAAAPLLLFLAACGGMGGGEDFTVESKASPQAMSGALAAGRVSEAAVLIPGLKADLSRPSDDEILYTIPMKGTDQEKDRKATILLRVEPGKDGKGSLVHATVDVPLITIKMGKQTMVVSESRIESELRKAIEKMGTNVAAGSGSMTAARPLSDLLAAVAIAGNFDLDAMQKNAIENPARMADLFGGLGEEGDGPARDIRADPDTVETVSDREPVEAMEPVDSGEAEEAEAPVE